MPASSSRELVRGKGVVGTGTPRNYQCPSRHPEVLGPWFEARKQERAPHHDGLSLEGWVPVFAEDERMK
jgi:hypothetical protein